MQGWKIKYLRNIMVPAELPLSISAFKKQQARWAKGSAQTALKLVPELIRCPKATTMQKIQGSIHLLGYFCHPLMFINMIITVSVC